MTDGKVEGLLVKDYFLEIDGDVHEWRHLKAPQESPTFQVPRFLRPLSDWINKLIKIGFTFEGIDEPYASWDAINQYPELQTTQIVAHSLIIRVRKSSEFQNPLREIIYKLRIKIYRRGFFRTIFCRQFRKRSKISENNQELILLLPKLVRESNKSDYSGAPFFQISRNQNLYY